jgi:hypothetical protein
VPCVDTSALSPLTDSSGTQVIDQATGLPEWMAVGDTTGTIILGEACFVPPGFPNTGDGSTAELFAP